MSWLWGAGALTLLILIGFYEGVRRAGLLYPARRWLLGLAIAAPLCLGSFTWLNRSGDCGPSSPPFAGMDLENMTLDQRLQALNTAKNEISARLAQCGGDGARWTLYQNLEILISELEAELKATQLQNFQSEN